MPGERTTLKLENRRELVVVGIAVTALAILVFLAISYQAVFLAYAIFSIFVFSVYLMLWGQSGKEPVCKPPKNLPSVSIIIPSFNSKGTIFECLKACRRMAGNYGGKSEIIVIDDCSSDGSFEMLSRMKGLRLFRKQKNSGKASALNFAISKAKGELVVCIDSDTYPSPDTMQKAVPHFYEKGNVGSVVAFVCVNNPKNLLQRVQEIEYWISFGFFFRAIATVNGLYVTPGPTAFYRKDALDRLGGFDEHNLSEDLEIALRLQKEGYRIAACHETIVYTDVPDTIGKLYTQRIRWYRGGVMNIIKYIDLFFNPKYGEFGLFVLPTMLGSGFLTALFMAWTLMFLGKSIISLLAPFAYDFSAGVTLTQIGLANGLITINSGWVLWLFSVAMWSYFLIKSFELANTKPAKRHIIPLLLMLSVYPLFIEFTFLVSYISELFGAKYKW